MKITFAEVRSLVQKYYRLSKPGIVYGNIITTIASFLFAARYHITIRHFLHLFVPTVIGLSLVIASAAVFNNYLDRDMDRKMARTKNRTLVTGEISVRSALIYASIIGIVGLLLIGVFVNVLSAAIALFGFFMYVVPYSLLKRTTYWAALIGTIPGAIPIVVGYTAVFNHFDLGALILFLVLVFWQMPHFYGIALYKLQEYKDAGIPVFPAAKGVEATKKQIVWYIEAYIVATILLWAFNYVGYVYLVLVLVFGLAWLWRGLQGRTAADDAKWARGVFRFSLIVLLSFCVTIAIAPLLPF